MLQAVTGNSPLQIGLNKWYRYCKIANKSREVSNGMRLNTNLSACESAFADKCRSIRHNSSSWAIMDWNNDKTCSTICTVLVQWPTVLVHLCVHLNNFCTVKVLYCLDSNSQSFQTNTVNENFNKYMNSTTLILSVSSNMRFEMNMCKKTHIIWVATPCCFMSVHGSETITGVKPHATTEKSPRYCILVRRIKTCL